MIFFIGIKGTGMAAMATMLYDLGYEVAGSDQKRHFFTEEPLVERGIKIYDFDEFDIPDGSTVIIGNAFLEDDSEVKKVRSNPTLEAYRYHEYLGKMIEGYQSFAIAGSHGKTTTTGLMTSMLGYNSKTGYLIGDGSGSIKKEDTNIVIEACEFKRHFLAYHVDYAVITNIEIDHVDYFKDDADYRSAYEEFSKNVSKALVVFGDDEEVMKCNFNANVITYGLKDHNDYQAINVVENQFGISFDLMHDGQLVHHFRLPFVGRHYLYNALAVIVLGLLQNISCENILAGLCTFKGVKRRFVISEHPNDVVMIDDYAHHPTEISVTIDAARTKFPNHKLVAIFKPHRVSRVYHFKQEFVDALSKADAVYLCDFNSIDDFDGPDINISYIADEIENAKILSEDLEGAKGLAVHAPACFLFMSSKDIYHLEENLRIVLDIGK